MPAGLGVPDGHPSPGEVLHSASGVVKAMVHSGFPGVLLGVTAPWTDRLSVQRFDHDAPALGWVSVRTASPVRMEQGVGAAYDVEVEPGHTYTYSPGFASRHPEHDVTVTIPGYGSGEAWLKHVHCPGLSIRLPRMPALDLGHGSWLSSQDVQGWGRYSVDGPAAMMPVGSMTLTVRSEDEYRRVSGILARSGVLLLQAEECFGVDSMYFRRGRFEWSRPGDLPGYRFRQVTLEVVTEGRPDRDLDQPVEVPGWPWERHARGLSLEDWARAYGTEWGLLSEGVRVPWQGPHVG